MQNDENVGENLCDIQFGDGFLYTTKHNLWENISR